MKNKWGHAAFDHRNDRENDNGTRKGSKKMVSTVSKAVPNLHYKAIASAKKEKKVIAYFTTQLSEYMNTVLKILKFY